MLSDTVSLCCHSERQPLLSRSARPDQQLHATRRFEYNPQNLVNQPSDTNDSMKNVSMTFASFFSNLIQLSSVECRADLQVGHQVPSSNFATRTQKFTSCPSGHLRNNTCHQTPRNKLTKREVRRILHHAEHPKSARRRLELLVSPAPAPVVDPGLVFHAPPTLVIEYLVLVPADTYSALTPVTKYMAPAPSSPCAAPVPVIEYLAPAFVSEGFGNPQRLTSRWFFSCRGQVRFACVQPSPPRTDRCATAHRARVHPSNPGAVCGKRQGDP